MLIKILILKLYHNKKNRENVREACNKIITKPKENEYIRTSLIYLVKSSKNNQRIYLLKLLGINNEQWTSSEQLSCPRENEN